MVTFYDRTTFFYTDRFITFCFDAGHRCLYRQAHTFERCFLQPLNYHWMESLGAFQAVGFFCTVHCRHHSRIRDTTLRVPEFYTDYTPPLFFSLKFPFPLPTAADVTSELG